MPPFEAWLPYRPVSVVQNTHLKLPISRLERWAPGVRSGPREFDGGAEIFVIEGELADTMGRYAAGTWLRLPVGSVMDAASETGCRLYLKTGALPGLRASSE